MRHLIAAFVILMYILAVPPPAISFTKATLKKDVPLKQGVFLVAKPELIDPNFLHTVILLVSYGKAGAMGLIINRPTKITIQQVIPDIKEPKNVTSNIYFGGPVNRNNLFALFTADKKTKEALNPLGKVYFTGSKDAILSLLKSEDKKEKVRIYAGYAGWVPNQLEFEIKRGSWVIVEASEEMIFTDFPENIWPSIFKRPEEIMTWNFK
jgi:putative transcriptional regulator